MRILVLSDIHANLVALETVQLAVVLARDALDLREGQHIVRVGGEDEDVVPGRLVRAPSSPPRGRCGFVLTKKLEVARRYFR